MERWTKQYIASTGEGKSPRYPRMLELSDWLRQHIPSEDSSGVTSGLVHGDFRIDNVVFHPTEVCPGRSFWMKCVKILLSFIQ